MRKVKTGLVPLFTSGQTAETRFSDPHLCSFLLWLRRVSMELLKISNSVFTVARQPALISTYQRGSGAALRNLGKWALSSQTDVFLVFTT